MLYLGTSEELVFWGAVMTFHNIAILFIPLGFLGGLSQSSLDIAIGSSVLWSVIAYFTRPKI